MRRGIIVQPSAPVSTPVPAARSFATVATAASPIITVEAARRAPPPGTVQGLLVGVDGKPIRGLSSATVKAHQAHTEEATERCSQCGKMRTPAQMQSVVGNAYRNSHPLRICNVPGDPESCVRLSYKPPDQEGDRWKPTIPRVRFDQDTGAPYDTKERPVDLAYLTKSDTYRSEAEAANVVDAHGRRVVGMNAPSGEGDWSGTTSRIGHVPKRRR